MLKDEGRFYSGYSIVIYDMTINCGNKPKTGRKQLAQGQLRPIRWVGGRTKGLLTSAASQKVLD